MAVKVLIIDDERLWRDQFGDLFIAMGFSSDAVTSPEEAKQRLAQNHYSLVVLDAALDQPSFNLICQNFCDYLRRQYPGIPVVAATGKLLTPDQVWNLLKMGVAETFYKPRIDLQDFQSRIRALTAQSVPEMREDEHPEAPIPSQHREQGWVTFKLQLAHQAGLEFEARALATPMGEPHATSRLPFDFVDLIAVLKVLENSGYDPADFTPVQTEVLQRLGLVRDYRLVPDHLKRIGKWLYDALFPSDVGVAFKMAFNQARLDRTTIFLQLRFDHDAVDLARYPWELLHDGQRHLVSAGAIEMTRYITYGEAAPTLSLQPPARLLFVESRPQDMTTLPPESERLVVWNALQLLTNAGKLTTERLERPTYGALLDRIDGANYHLIHFDGHGLFARRCPHCRTLNHAHLIACHSCQTSLEDVQAQGFLAFESDSGKVDLVGTEDMENLLLSSQVRLMFLSACQTGVVRGDSLFGGLGPGLIRAGVPAVVAMQFSVPVQATISFAESFYTALARGETVSRAVAQGRRRLRRDDTWFIPTLYLRSQDDEGHIFSA